jgi:hypothetical protein
VAGSVSGTARVARLLPSFGHARRSIFRQTTMRRATLRCGKGRGGGARPTEIREQNPAKCERSRRSSRIVRVVLQQSSQWRYRPLWLMRSAGHVCGLQKFSWIIRASRAGFSAGAIGHCGRHRYQGRFLYRFDDFG